MLVRHTQPLADLVIDAEVDRWSQWLRHPEGQIKALRAAAPIIAAVHPAHVARHVARLADRIGLDHAIVTEAVSDALTEIIAVGQMGSSRKESAPRGDLRTQPCGGLPEAPRRQPSTAARAAALDFPNNAQRAIGQTAPPEPADGQGRPARSPEARLHARRIPG
jgi:hypothetical protein